MPILVIYGMPRFDNADKLERLIAVLVKAVEYIPELKLEEGGQTSVFIQTDPVEKGLGEELVCIVEGLLVKQWYKPEEVRQRLAAGIYILLQEFARTHIPQCCRIDVFVKQFNPEKDGFASGNPQVQR